MDKYNETKTDSQIQRTNRWLPEARRGRGMSEAEREIKRRKLPITK